VIKSLLITLLIALATHRLWRLAALDYITDGLRDRLAPEETKRRVLISCPWCLGTWLTAAVWAITWAATPLEVPWLVLAAATSLTGLLGAADSQWSQQ
jgi:hypothetical protein